mmetsp:Transcript_72422/g.235240  ORF Transcript_72422/g.235240 Transcript_72422/m.235240 type:complete len:221 (+) Transcript_72422:393-1055(+)
MVSAADAALAFAAPSAWLCLLALCVLAYFFRFAISPAILPCDLGGRLLRLRRLCRHLGLRASVCLRLRCALLRRPLLGLGQLRGLLSHRLLHDFLLLRDHLVHGSLLFHHLGLGLHHLFQDGVLPFLARLGDLLLADAHGLDPQRLGLPQVLRKQKPPQSVANHGQREHLRRKRCDAIVREAEIPPAPRLQARVVVGSVQECVDARRPGPRHWSLDALLP